MRECGPSIHLLTLLTLYGSGCEPLTPDDIAEVVVFAVGRRENVVLADTLCTHSPTIFQCPICSRTTERYNGHASRRGIVSANLCLGWYGCIFV